MREIEATGTQTAYEGKSSLLLKRRKAGLTIPVLTLPPGNVLFQIRAISLVCPDPELLR